MTKRKVRGAGRGTVDNAAVIKALLVRPVGILPNETGDPVKPWAIGLGHELVALLKPERPRIALRRAIARYLHSLPYLYALADPLSKRHDLEGKVVADVAPEHRQRAVAMIAEISERRRQHQARPQANATGLGVLEQPAAEPLAPPTPSPVPLTRAEMIRASLLARKAAG